MSDTLPSTAVVHHVEISPDGVPGNWSRSSHSYEDHATVEQAAMAALDTHHRHPALYVRVVEVVTTRKPVRWVVPAAITSGPEWAAHWAMGSLPVGHRIAVLGPPAVVRNRCQYDRDDSINEQCQDAAVDGSWFCAPHAELERRP